MAAPLIPRAGNGAIAKNQQRIEHDINDSGYYHNHAWCFGVSGSTDRAVANYWYHDKNYP